MLKMSNADLEVLERLHNYLQLSWGVGDPQMKDSTKTKVRKKAALST